MTAAGRAPRRSYDRDRMGRGSLNRTGPAFVAASTAAALALATGLAWILESFVGVGDASPVYLLAVTAVAVVFGTVPAIAAAALGFLAYNFLFTHPRFTLIVADPGQLLTLFLLLVVGVVVGQLAGGQRQRALVAERREREARVLFEISRALALRSDTGSALREIVDVLERNAGFAQVWIGLGTSPGAERPLTAAPPDRDTIGSHMVLQRGQPDAASRWMRVHPPVGPERLARPGRLAYRVPIEAGGETRGSLWATDRAVEGDPGTDESRMFAAAADQIGQALEQDRLRAEAISAELARGSEAMKSALLESVSHDLRTPLAAIRAAAGALLDEPGSGPADERREIAQSIDDEARRMDRLVGNLLDVSRIEAGGVTVDLQPYVLDDLVAATVQRFGPQLAGDLLEVRIPPDLPYVLADALLLDQVLTNLIDNALRHAPGARIRIGASADHASVALVVEDAGAGVPDEALHRIFDKFVRLQPGAGRARRGVGIGLAVVRGLLVAMGGSAEARRSELGGLAVICRLQAASLPREAG